MKVFRLFRHKKYGEPIEPPKPVDEENEEEHNYAQDVEDILKKNKKGKNTKGPLNTDELITVIEEESVVESDNGENPTVRSQQECEDYIHDQVVHNLIYDYILLHADNVLRVKSFLLMVLHRRRYLKTKASAKHIQKCLRLCLAKQKVQRMRQEIRDKENCKKLEQMIISKKDPMTLDQAAVKIQSLYHRLRYKKDLQEMRAQMKKLPYVCRSSYVKMNELKLSTKYLMKESSNKFKK